MVERKKRWVTLTYRKGGMSMIPNQWYAVLNSKKVKKGEVLGARRCGMDLAFFRDDHGMIHVVQDLCNHRRASLSKGKVVDGCIRCPFHGIEYDGEGKCTFVPSEGLSSEKDYSRFHLKHYPAREQNDIIYLWYGEGEPREEVPSFPELDGKLSYYEIVDHWKVDYSRIIENQLDVSHLPFVHHNTIGRGGKTLVNGPKVRWKDEVTLQTSADNEVDRGQKNAPPEDAKIKTTNLQFKFPNQWLNTIAPPKLYVFAYFVPVDEENALICLRFYNRFTGVSFLDKAIAFVGSLANKVVERQDKRVVETQLPKKTGLGIGENLVQADRPIMEYRKKRRQLQREH